MEVHQGFKKILQFVSLPPTQFCPGIHNWNLIKLEISEGPDINNMSWIPWSLRINTK